MDMLTALVCDVLLMIVERKCVVARGSRGSGLLSAQFSMEEIAWAYGAEVASFALYAILPEGVS